ncbi:hypothetical protein AT1219_90020 [Vibrio alginolyticus]
MEIDVLFIFISGNSQAGVKSRYSLGVELVFCLVGLWLLCRNILDDKPF